MVTYVNSASELLSGNDDNNFCEARQTIHCHLTSSSLERFYTEVWVNGSHLIPSNICF
ncbi:hypothetical protein BJ165DRAFT_1488340, partial [Panaeolus papilionaceus]